MALTASEPIALIFAEPGDMGFGKALIDAVRVQRSDLDLALTESLPRKLFGSLAQAVPVVILTGDDHRMDRQERAVARVLAEGGDNRRLLVIRRGQNSAPGFDFGPAEMNFADWDGDPQDNRIQFLIRQIVLASDILPVSPYPEAQGEPVTFKMLHSIDLLPLSGRTRSLLMRQHIHYVGDLVQHTEVELLRIHQFGRSSLYEVRASLGIHDLHLGMVLKGWPPEDIEGERERIEEAARRAEVLQQSVGGATFTVDGDRLAMESIAIDDDRTAALSPLTAQMQGVLLEKARSFGAICVRLDNQPGWAGIARSVQRLAELLDRPAEQLPDILGYLYPAAIELGSFIELDDRLQNDTGSNATRLDPDMRRPLSDLVRNLAPWLRAFSSIRQLDDDASRFLLRAAEIQPSVAVVQGRDGPI
jgi:hypothetical protein